jgi:hypothetical protein
MIEMGRNCFFRVLGNVNDNLVKGNLINIAKCLNSGSVLVFTIQPNQPNLN